MSLSDAKIRSIKPSAKSFKLTDSQGLYLLVNPGGSRLWYLKYRFNRKESRIALGAYPQVSLSDACQQRDGIRKLLAQNINPAQQRMTEKAAASPEKCFEAVAVAWHKTNKKWSADYAECILASMNNHIFPAIGHLPVTMLKTQHFTALLKVTEDISGLHHPAGMPQVTAAQVHHRHTRWDCWAYRHELPVQYSRQTHGSFEHPCSP